MRMPRVLARLRRTTPLSSGAVALLRRLLTEFGAQHWSRYALAVLCMGIAAGCTAGSAYLIGDVINQAYVYKNLPGIIVLCLVTTLLFTAKGIASYVQTVVLSRIANSIVAENQRRMFATLLSQGVGYFSDRHSSEFIMRLNFGAGAVGAVLNQLIIALGRDLLTLIGLSAVMVLQDPWLSLIAFVVLPPAVLTVRRLTRRARNIILTEFTSGMRFVEIVVEAVQGIRIVKAFGLEKPMIQSAENNILAYEKAANKLARVSNRASPLMETLGGVAISVMLFYAGFRVLVMGGTPGEFVSFITAFLLAYEPAKRLTRLHLDVGTSLVGVELLFDFLDSPVSEPADGQKPLLAVTDGRVEFRNVTFEYRPGQPVIRNMSFATEPRQVTAFVGPSGGGKTTIVNLILRFYDAAGGSILIDGTDIRSVSRASLRRQVAYVGQDVYLFRGTIRENIAAGGPDATDDQIIEAAKLAFAHDFIISFPRGYDTEVGEHGTQLSGGQRQRISIARALLRDAPIILLDEATAALDSESEARIQEALNRLCADRTTIVIAHRLQTVMNAHRIYVVENGEIVEAGVHDMLIRKNGRYKAFYTLQLGKPQEADVPQLAAS
jgi:ABC-type multidrug transport system fused ATPase/permease subunit